MSPLNQPVHSAAVDWDLPNGLNGCEFRELAATDMDVVADDEVHRIAKFADLWLAGDAKDTTAVRNQPIRASRWMEVEIGHGTFGKAKSAWLASPSGEVAALTPTRTADPTSAAAMHKDSGVE